MLKIGIHLERVIVNTSYRQEVYDIWLYDRHTDILNYYRHNYTNDPSQSLRMAPYWVTHGGTRPAGGIMVTDSTASYSEASQYSLIPTPPGG